MAIELPAVTSSWFTGVDNTSSLVVLVPSEAARRVARELTEDTTLEQLQALIVTYGAQAEDIDGWSLSWMVKRHKADADADALIHKEDDDITIVSAEGGVASVSVLEADIEDIVAGRQYWEEWKRIDTGFKTVLMQRPFILGQAVHGVTEA